MAKRTYTVEFENVSVAAAQDLFSITPADDKPVEVIGLLLAQSSDVGDAAEEILRYRIIRGHTTASSGGTAPTPRPLDRSGAASGFTSRVNDTTIAAAGTPINLLSDCFNIRAGLQLWLPEEAWPEASQADTILSVRLMSTPGDALSMSGTLFLKEGG